MLADLLSQPDLQLRQARSQKIDLLHRLGHPAVHCLEVVTKNNWPEGGVIINVAIPICVLKN